MRDEACGLGVERVALKDTVEVQAHEARRPREHDANAGDGAPLGMRSVPIIEERIGFDRVKERAPGRGVRARGFPLGIRDLIRHPRFFGFFGFSGSGSARQRTHGPAWSSGGIASGMGPR